MLVPNQFFWGEDTLPAGRRLRIVFPRHSQWTYRRLYGTLDGCHHPTTYRVHSATWWWIVVRGGTTRYGGWWKQIRLLCRGWWRTVAPHGSLLSPRDGWVVFKMNFYIFLHNMSIFQGPQNFGWFAPIFSLASTENPCTHCYFMLTKKINGIFDQDIEGCRLEYRGWSKFGIFVCLLDGLSKNAENSSSNLSLHRKIWLLIRLYYGKFSD